VKRLMVTGASGFVGGSVLIQARDRWEILAVTRAPRKVLENTASWVETLDITDRNRLRACMVVFRPDAVIHAAALADIDYCECHPETAFAVNTTGTYILAECCAEVGARLVFCSTDTVFDGKRGMYTEADPPSPVNVYARSKADAEICATSYNGNTVIARLSLVLGIPLLAGGNAFLPGLLRRLNAGEMMPFPTNEIRTPVDVITVGAALLELAESDYRGLLHLAGCSRVSRYEMACRIARQLGFSDALIEPVDSSAMTNRAPRPADVSLDNSLARSTLATPMLPLEDGLDFAIRTAKEML